MLAQRDTRGRMTMKIKTRIKAGPFNHGG